MASVMAMLCSFPTLAASEPEPNGDQSARSVYYPIKARPLGDVLRDIAMRSGIHFRLADGLRRDKITETLSAKSWSEATKVLLQGYNYAVEVGKGGVWETVTISGKNGDGKDAVGSQANRKEKFLSYSRSEIQDLPARYRGLKPGSVSPVTLPLAALKGMKKGKTVSLDLPAGQYSLVHDNRFNHENGEVTWVGYLEEEGQPYRAMITMGKFGPMGHLVTPDGIYQIVTEDGQTYMIDINASGLQSGSFLEDQAAPNANPNGDNGKTYAPTTGGVGPNVAAYSPSAAASANPVPTTSTAPSDDSSNTSVSTIDLLVLYAKGLAQPDTRINYLTALTNQAFLDSRVNSKIRVVYRQPVDYTETNDNSQALSDLTYATGPFEKIPALREKYGADLVTLIRPFHASAQKGCGVAWVNGSNGSGLSPFLAYSVVSDGGDQDGELVYCGQQALAHELGHNLGNVHDRAFTSVSGAFPYSYAWGVEGSFGTIMSYLQPNLLLFATPLLGNACHYQPCGYAEGDPNASDNARTINQTAPLVSGFQPTVVPDKSN